MKTTIMFFFIALAISAAMAQNAPGKILSKRHQHHKTNYALPSNNSSNARVSAITTIVSEPGKQIYYTTNNYTGSDQTTSWTYANTTTYTYDSKGNVLQQLTVDTVTNTENRLTNTYDNYGNTIGYVYEYYNGSSWDTTDTYSSTYTYDNNGNVTTETDSSNKKPSYKYVYTYDANGNLTSEVDIAWDTTTKAFVNNAFYVYNYANNTLTSSTYQQWSTVTNSWINKENDYNITWNAYLSPFNYYNTNSGNFNYELSSSTAQKWTGSQWVDSSKVSIVYPDSYGSDIETDQIFNGTTWRDTTRYTDSYDSYGDYLGYTEQAWNGTSWDTIQKSSTITTYYHDSNGNLAEQLSVDTSGSYTTASKYIYSNFQTLSVTSIQTSSVAITINAYPNPTNGSVTISVPEAGLVTVYNSLGEVVTTQTVNTGNAALSLGNAATGVYTLILTGQNNAYTPIKVVKD